MRKRIISAFIKTLQMKLWLSRQMSNKLTKLVNENPLILTKKNQCKRLFFISVIVRAVLIFSKRITLRQICEEKKNIL